MASVVEKKEVEKDSKDTRGQAETAMVRSQIYRLLSLAYLYPNNKDLITTLCDGSFTGELKNNFSYIAVNCAGDEIKKKAEDALENLDALEGLVKSEFKDRDRAYLEKKYLQVFGHTVNKSYPPTASHYGSEHIFQKSQDTGDISGWYRAFGMEKADNLAESLDHISVELEFMHVLTHKEGYALTNHGQEKADIVIKAQKKFIKKQVGAWGVLFAMLLIKNSQDGFYKQVAALLRIFLQMEAMYLKVKPKKLKAPQSSDSLDESERMGGTMDCSTEKNPNLNDSISNL